MDRTPNRPSRSQRYQADPEQPQENAAAEDSAAPRRRRSQAARLHMEETMANTLVDTITPSSSRETSESQRRFSRPANERRREDGSGKKLYENTLDDPYDSLYEDDAYDDDAYDDGTPPRRRTVRWVIVLVVVLVILAVITFIGLRRPDFVEPVVQWGIELFAGPTEEPTPEPTVEPTATPEPIPDVSMAVVLGFSAEPMEQQELDEQVVFTINTTKDTQRVQVVNVDNGEILVEASGDEYVDYDYARTWSLPYYFEEPYDGYIEAHPGIMDEWNDEGTSRIPIKAGMAQLAAALEPEPAAADTSMTTIVDGATSDSFTTIPVDQIPQTAVQSPTGAAQGGLQMNAGFQAYSVQVAGQVFNVSGSPMTSYSRTSRIQMGDANSYIGSDGMRGVLTFRGSNMRQNAAYGTVSPTELRLERAWSVSVGNADNGMYAFGSQPLIVQWHEDIRKMMDITENKKSVEALKEVIFAGNDGFIYFVDLYDGQQTRNPLAENSVTPMYGTPSVYPLGYPVMITGNGDPATMGTDGTTKMSVYDLLVNFARGSVPAQNSASFSNDSTFTTSPLIDNDSDTMLMIGGNGLLYTLSLNTKLSQEGTLDFVPVSELTTYRGGAEGENTAVSGSLAAYGEYAYYATRGGVLQCVNVNTLESVWALQVGADTNAAIALQTTASGTVLYLATKSDVEGLAHMRRIDAASGAILWDQTIPGSITASPLVGTGTLEGMVFFNIRNAESGSTLLALRTETGAEAWRYEMEGVNTSSPIALYDDIGNAWIVQGDESGLQLIRATDGSRIDYLDLGSGIYGSPAAYDDIIVAATQDGKLHAVVLK